ncbi:MULTISPECIES: peptidoglycan D,D-transpeptidase FtsI family protein [Bacillus]|uniref:peptidoglycan D,D-transpeptidase FtsI family protein n=1 Tax=Bacillus TaxID=1386 RepID=UPI0002E77520|nr:MULTISPECIES: penicillin-binding protein 2 [Bacillus]
MKSKKKKLQKIIPTNRLNLLFLVVFVLFAGLIIRLGFVQIVSGEKYNDELNRTNLNTIKQNVPRGRILDRNHNIIVDNVGVNSIVYTQGEHEKNEVMLKTAKKLIQYIDVDTSRITERDKKDYWMIIHPKKAVAKLSQEELTDEKLKPVDQYHLQLERITSKDLATLSNEDLKILAVFREMKRGRAFTPQPIKNVNVIEKEIARVSEALDELPGVDIVIDWNRKYQYGDIFRSVLGNVSSAEKGLPKEKLDYYQARGYSLNDRVGTSQLELQYEDVLQGVKAVNQIVTNNNGDIIGSKKVKDGKQGNDLILSTDIRLQKKVEEVLTNELIRAKSGSGGKHLDRAYVVMMNPVTGEVLSMSGKRINEKNGKYEVTDDALGTINSAYAMGSSVKGATVLTGYKTGAISPGSYLVDGPIQLKGARVKKSVSSMGLVNEISALQRSSNVYMFKVAIRMLGREYSPGMKLPNNPKVFEEMRFHFNQFGLGVRTGIDLPNESSGFKQTAENPGLLLDFAIGQYDTYTPMQLAQYVSTIANGGYRVKPHLVKEIRETNPNEMENENVIKTINPEYLNQLDNSKAELSNVQEGFRRVYQVQRGTAYTYFNQEPYRNYKLAGKTGTAQSFYYDPILRKTFLSEPTYNLTLVGYAPFDNPEIAFAIVVPDMGTDKDPVNKYIGQGIIKAYFDLKAGEQGQAKE